MAHLGIFSSLIPYVVLVLSYITAVGYFSFAKKGSFEENAANELFVVDSNDDTPEGNLFYYADSENVQSNVIDSQNNSNIDLGIIHFKILHYGNHSPGKLLKHFRSNLFSRPPPYTVC